MAFLVGATTTNKIENYTTPGDVTHSDPAMTARVYLGRKMSTSLAASKL